MKLMPFVSAFSHRMSPFNLQARIAVRTDTHIRYFPSNQYQLQDSNVYKLLNLSLHLWCFVTPSYCSPPSAACANRIDIARVLSTDSASRSDD